VAGFGFGRHKIVFSKIRWTKIKKQFEIKKDFFDFLNAADFGIQNAGINWKQ
jgi:hypothetical protein